MTKRKKDASAVSRVKVCRACGTCGSAPCKSVKRKLVENTNLSFVSSYAAASPIFILIELNVPIRTRAQYRSKLRSPKKDEIQGNTNSQAERASPRQSQWNSGKKFARTTPPPLPAPPPLPWRSERAAETAPWYGYGKGKHRTQMRDVAGGARDAKSFLSSLHPT